MNKIYILLNRIFKFHKHNCRCNPRIAVLTMAGVFGELDVKEMELVRQLREYKDTLNNCPDLYLKNEF